MITTKDKILYGMGGFGKNVAYGIVASYTFYYYKTVLGISGSFVGILLMIARIFDAFNDPLMGIVVAKTKSRFGKYKPWILSGAVLNAFILYAMFSVPQSLSQGAVNVYVAVTYFLCGITYTLSDIPYWSIVPATTRAGKDRESMTLVARTFSAIGAAVPTILTMALIPILGGGSTNECYRTGFSRIALITAVLYVVTTVITVLNLPNTELSEPKDTSIKELFGALFRNDQALWLAFIIVLFNSATYLSTNLAVYIFEYEIGRENGNYTIFMAACGIVQFLAMVVFYPVLRKKFNNRKIFMIACIVGIIGYALFIPMMFVESIGMLHVIFTGVLMSFANGTVYVLITVFVADAVDYGEEKSGHRDDSVVSSLQTLMVKLSSAFAVLIVGVGMDLVGFVGVDANSGVEEAVQTVITPAMHCGLRLLFVVPSMILMALALVFFIRQKRIGDN